MFTGILYTHILYALGGSEMPNGQNLRPIAAGSRTPLHTVRMHAWAVDQSLNLDRSIDRSKAYVNLWYSGPLMIRSIAENCTARSNFDYGIHFRSTVM